MFHDKNQTISFFLGLVVLALGLIPVLHAMGIIGFTYPPVEMVLWIAAILGGTFLFIDGLKEASMMNKGLGIATFVVGLIVLALGLIPVLGSMGVIGFALPGFVAALTHYVLIIGGLLLMVAAFKPGV